MPEWISPELKNAETLLYYDEPLLWVGIDLKDQKYLILSVGDSAEGLNNRWLMVPLSTKIHELLLSQNISIFAAFELGAESQIIEITENEGWDFQTLKGSWKNMRKEDLSEEYTWSGLDREFLKPKLPFS